MDLHFTGKVTGIGSITKEDYIELVNDILRYLDETGWVKKTGNVLTILIKGFEERVLQGRIGGPAPIPRIETVTVHLLNLETRPGGTRKVLVKKRGSCMIFPSGEEVNAKTNRYFLSDPLTETEVLDYARRGYASNNGEWEESKTLEKSWLGNS